MANILAVDDNLELCKLIRTTLERDGHRVETRQAGRDLTEALCRWADCILLDVMMPGEDGFAVCRRIRSLTEVPILFLSARTDEAAVLEGLGIGADDFLSKPFRVAELRARVAAHLRRQSRTPAHRMVRSGVAFDLTARSAAVEGRELPLTRSEYAICEYLALHAGQTFTKEQIYEAVFGIDGTADDTAVTQHIKNIRAKLRAAGVPEPEKLLNTVWGVGYRWKSEDGPLCAACCCNILCARRWPACWSRWGGCWWCCCGSRTAGCSCPPIRPRRPVRRLHRMFCRA